SESLDAGLDVWAPRIRQCLGRGRLRLFVEAKSAQAHTEPSELHMDVFAGGEPLHRSHPAGKHLVAPTGVSTDSDRPTNMVEDDSYLRKRVREARELVDLRVEQPRVERQAKTAEHSEAFSEARVSHQVRLRDVCRVTYGRVGVPSRDMANAAKA